ncbi:MAG: 2,3-bisphosphoglycerate-independent phosphoglycerate mutase [Alphaproteobacteria bacterium]|nr:2,3-bisphosphoglycerate-independent phosphoglycerate mutase [Alphaproteobacteria bacterium]
MTRPVVLCIMDGVGISTDKKNNAVTAAKMPFFNELLNTYPHSQLSASGTAVGLPEGVMGNSEVGHITIGSGRVVNQFLRRFQLEDWNTNQPLNDFIHDVKKSGGIVHVAGLMSDGRVHSDINDIITIIKYVVHAGLRVCLHFIADGRDTPPQSAKQYIQLIKTQLSSEIADNRVIFGTVSGRYYAMDRNNNNERTQMAFDAIALAKSDTIAPDIDSAINHAYEHGETDEFIKPIVIKGDMPISDKDGFIFGNYRSDRARQIMRSILTTGAKILCFSQYGEGLNEVCPALLPDVAVENTLGDVLSENGLRQLRISETEKYNHVTYFFDAERNIDFEGEQKILIPSPDVATFDLKPEMSAVEITDKLLPVLGDYDVVILNYANGDMVGHTGNMQAAVCAMETLDTQLARLVPAVLALGGIVLITADHGNAEKMVNSDTGAPWTAHTTNPVNFIVVGNGIDSVNDGGLADIAPTILKILGIEQPKDMTGHSLI